jgi:hypothetical protein
MERAHIDSIREAVRKAERAASAALDSCDVDDVDEVIASVEQELSRPNPNKNTLSTYLNSLARSLRSLPSAQGVCDQLDSAMRDAGVPDGVFNMVMGLSTNIPTKGSAAGPDHGWKPCSRARMINAYGHTRT